MSPLAAAVFLAFALGIGLWVSWSDMKFMKIPNQASIAMLAIWVFPGILIVPLQAWAWAPRYTHRHRYKTSPSSNCWSASPPAGPPTTWRA